MVGLHSVSNQVYADRLVRFASQSSSASGPRKEDSAEKNDPAIINVALKERVFRDSLAPDLKKRLERIPFNQQRLTGVIEYDINDYQSYERQPRWLRPITRFFIGLFQPWRKRPALLYLREQLKSKLTLNGQRPELRKQFEATFNQQFDKVLTEYREVLRGVNLPQAVDQQVLYAALEHGAQKQNKLLAAPDLYPALMAHFLEAASDKRQVAQDSPDRVLKRALSRFAKALYSLPQLVNQDMAKSLEDELQNSIEIVPQRFIVTQNPDGSLRYEVKPMQITRFNYTVSDGDADTDEDGTVYNAKVSKSPDFLHLEEAEIIMDKTFNNLLPECPMPTIVLGHLDDQRDLLTQLAIDPRVKRNAFALVVESDDDPLFNHHWDKLPVADDNKISPEEDVIAALKDHMAFLQAATPKKEKAMLFVIGKEETLHQALKVLPDLARDYPRVKVVVSGMQQVPVTIPASARDQMGILPVKPPTVRDILSTITHVKTEAIARIRNQYQADIDAEALRKIAESYASNNNGRPPSAEVMLSKLERVTAWARRRADQNAEREAEAAEREKRPPAPQARLVVTSDVVAEYDALREQFVRNVTGAPDSKRGSFFTIHYQTGVGFDQVIGQNEPIEELQHLAKRMKDNPYDIDLPRLLIFSGPPGVGKTLSAKAFAQESGVNMIAINAARFAELYVGVAAKRVSEIFDIVNDGKPWLIFIDEVDSVAKERTGASDGGSEKEDALNQLLTEIDGFSKKNRNKVTVAVATNRPDLLDGAFHDRGEEFKFKPFNLKNRLRILELHKQLAPKGVVFAPDVNLEEIAQKAVSSVFQTNDNPEGAISGRRLGKIIERAIRHADKIAPDGKPPVVTQEILLKQLEALLPDEKPRMGFIK